MIYEVKKGKHSFRSGLCLPKIRKRPSILTYEVILSGSAIYVLDNEDQLDWNKGGGYSFDLFTNHKNSFMWAWRYNIEKAVFEVTHYVHDGDKIHKGDNSFLSVPAGQKFIIDVTIQKDKYLFWMQSGNNLVENVVYHNSKQGNIVREINPWFGGNRPAPTDLSFWMKKFVK